MSTLNVQIKRSGFKVWYPISFQLSSPKTDTVSHKTHNSPSPELKTLEWWKSGLRLNPLFFLISRLNIACSPIIFNLQINYPIRIKDIPFESFQLWHFHFFLCNLQWQTIKDDLQIVLLLSCFVGHCICFAIKQIHCYTAVNLIVKLKFPIFKNMEERCSLDLRLRPAAFLPGRNQD